MLYIVAMLDNFNFGDYGFEMPEIDLDIFGAESSVNLSNRHHRPAKQKAMPDSKVKYRNAQALAKDMPATPGMWHICLIDGSFIAGDFLEAFVKHNNLHAKRISISTLALNQENVDSLGNLLFDGWCDEMELIVSDGFYANYRNDIIPYIYQELDTDANNFQLAVARVHTKVTLIETHCGMKIVFRGSANLRSAHCIEHLEVQENAGIFDFFAEFHSAIIGAFSTINQDEPSVYKKKMLTKTDTWQAVT